MFLLLGSKRTRRGRNVGTSVGLISRRVSFSSHFQSTGHGEGGLITVGGCCKTIRTSTARCAGDREGRKGRAAYKGGGDVIANHPPLSSIGEPGKCHGSSDLRILGPRSSAIR